MVCGVDPLAFFEELIARLGGRSPDIHINSDFDGIGVELDSLDWNKAENGSADELTTHRFLSMRLLLESGEASPIKNGIYLPSANAVRLEQDERNLFSLPSGWPFAFALDVEGTTPSTKFEPQLFLIDGLGNRIANYEIDGPLVYLSTSERFLPDPGQFLLFDAIRRHHSLDEDERSEYENLRVIVAARSAKEAGVDVKLPAFESLELIEPTKVGVSIETQEDGSLVLSPSFGCQLDQSLINGRLQQLEGEAATGSLRVGKTIVLLDESRKHAAREILANRKISADQKASFLNNPTAWLDASMIDLDNGFSVRVLGAGPLKLAYFGETEESGISWFERPSSDRNQGQQSQDLLPADALVDLIDDADELAALQKKITHGIEAAADAVRFKGKEFDISDAAAISKAVEAIEERLALSDKGESLSEFDPPPEIEEEPTIIEIETHDESITSGGLPKPENLSFTSEIDFRKYRRQPYPHQEVAIRWLLALAQSAIDGDGAEGGALLADDMGLGKTFSAIVFLSEFLAHLEESEESVGPVLVVAPLVLMDTWKRELNETYVESPFSRIIVLQAQADLRQYKCADAGSELRMNRGEKTRESDVGGPEPETNRGTELPRDDLLRSIKYALKVGKEFGADRIDSPGTIVITTFATLRDYQFSLAKVPWSIVVIDEAQNVKNPNAIQTRAAKALNSRFKLLMTGTPVENHLGEFWCLADTFAPGVLGHYQSFRQRYVKPIIAAEPDAVGETKRKIGEELRADIDGFMLRRDKAGTLTGLPAKHVHVGWADAREEALFDERLRQEMKGEQLAHYDASISATLSAMEDEKGSGSALAGIARLRQVVLHPDLIGGGNPGMPTSRDGADEFFHSSGKLHAVRLVLEEVALKGEKALVFLISKAMQQSLSAAFRQYFGCKAAIINGDTKTFSSRQPNRTRQGLIDEFEKSPGFEVLIMSPVAAGVGLTINAANHVIHLERHWNPAKEGQATDRVYRIGQQNDVHVYYPTLTHPEGESFDEKLNKLISSKISLSEAIVVPEEATPDELIGAGIFGQHRKPSDQEITLDKVDKLGWKYFEALVAELMATEHAKDVILTPASNDYGCDVVVVGNEGPNTLIQVKHTEKSSLVDSHAPINEVYGSRPHYASCLGLEFEKLLVITNAKKFSAKARAAAKNYGVSLLGRHELGQMLSARKVMMGAVIRRDANRVAP